MFKFHTLKHFFTKPMHSNTEICQLPDFSQRSQTVCYTADFSTTFLYILKTKTFCTSHHKTISEHPRIQEFLLYFAKNFCDFRQKREKRLYPAGSSCACACLWPDVTCTVKHLTKFTDFFETQCWQPCHNTPLYIFYSRPSSV